MWVVYAQIGSKISYFKSASKLFDEMLDLILFLVGHLGLWKLTWHVFGGLIFILVGPWLEQRQHLDFPLLNPAKGRGEDVQVAILLKGQ